MAALRLKSAVEIKFAVSSKQSFGLGDMMSGFGPKRTRVHSASRHACDDRKERVVMVAPKVVAPDGKKMPRVDIAAQSKITGTEDIERCPRPSDNIPNRLR